jgi:hypothetical protein
MNKEQSLQIIKATIDLSIANGIFKNMESVNQILQAFQNIVNEIKDVKPE